MFLIKLIVWNLGYQTRELIVTAVRENLTKGYKKTNFLQRNYMKP